MKRNSSQSHSRKALCVASIAHSIATYAFVALPDALTVTDENNVPAVEVVTIVIVVFGIYAAMSLAFVLVVYEAVLAFAQRREAKRGPDS